MRIKVNAAKRLTEMKLGEPDHTFGFSVEDIAEVEYETSESTSLHSLVWRDFDTGYFYEMEWAEAGTAGSVFDVKDGMVRCQKVVPEQGSPLTWRQI